MIPALKSRSAASIAPYAREWLQSSPRARLLNVFPRACNLIDERGGVISLVVPGVGDGPFNLVLEGPGPDFTGLIHEGDAVAVYLEGLIVGELVVNACRARVWSARPDWEVLHAGCERIVSRIPLVSRWLLERAPAGSLAELLEKPGEASSAAGLDLPYALNTGLVEAARLPAQQLTNGIVTGDLEGARQAASSLAGLGSGLTPAGDDFLLGAVYALWILYPASKARSMVATILAPAVSLTTSLSSAWLRAAARGEAGARWHDFFRALHLGAPADLLLAAETLLASGHTSGADALAGFTAVCQSWENVRSPACPV